MALTRPAPKPEAPEVFHFSLLKAVLLGLLLVPLAAATWDDYWNLRHNRHEVAIGVLMTLAVAAVLLDTVVRRVRLSGTGVEARGLLGSGSMRWDEVDTVRYRVRRGSHRIELSDRRGETLRFGRGIHRAASMAKKVMLATTPHVYRRRAPLYNRGVDVRFGPIRVHATRGVEVPGLRGSRRVPWAEITGVEVMSDILVLKLRGDDYATGRNLNQVPNGLVLLMLLQNALAVRSDTGAPAPVPVPGTGTGTAGPDDP